MRNPLAKLYLLITTLALVTTSISAQTLTEGFETGLPTSGSGTAQNYTLASGVWNILKGASTSTAHSGSLALKLSSGSSTPTYASAPGVNAVSTASFWAKGSSATTITIQKSINGGAYTTVATQAITTTYTLYTIPVNETNNDVSIRFENATSQTLYVDDVTITGGVVTPTPAVSISATSLPSFGNVVTGNSSAASTYAVSGTNLTANISVTAPTGFQVSTNNSTFASSVTLTETSGTVASTTIYARFSPSSASGSTTGNIANTSTGATTQNVSVSGNALAAQPTTQGSISFGTVTTTSIVVNLPTVGNGTNRIIVAKSGSAVSTDPTDATAYTANATFKSGTQIGSGNYVVYNGTGSSVTVSGLSASTTYYFAVYEYNVGTGTSQNYLTPSTVTGNQLTATPPPTPTVSISSTSLPSFGNVVTGSVSAASTYNVSGTNLTANISITAPTAFQVSTDNSTFASSVTLTETSGTVASTTIYARFSPSSANGSATGNIANTSSGATTQNVSVSGNAVATQPTTQGSISFGTVTSTSIVVNLPTVGNGTNRIIVAKSGSAVSTDPTDATAYTANATFKSGTQIGSGNYVVYNGTGSTVTVSGLSASTTYYFAVYEYNVGTGTSQNYLTPSTVIGNQLTSGVTIPPAIAFDTALTTHFINPPYVSGVISDPTDPASTDGIVVDITANGAGILAANYTLTASSSKTSVVPTANIIITKSDGTANIKIIPAAVGYANITLTMKSGSTSKTLVIDYAASAASSTPTSTFWHTGYSDASAAIRLDSNYMVIGDDEFNDLFVSDRNHSGLPVKTFYFGDQVGLTDGSAGDYKEADIEASTPSAAFPGRSYWTGSMSNGGSSNKYEPDRNTIFATNITGTGAATSFSVVGHYNNLLTQLVTWGNANGYNFTASTASGHDPKTIDGFNVEGMAIGPDNTTLFIGFRAPLVPTSNRTNALIAPLLNFETWFNNGKPSGNPTFGAPIQLNLGNRGIRDIVKLSNGDYIIVAGSYEGSDMVAALFKWTGKATDAPLQMTNMDISALNAEACVEMHVNGQLATNELQVISDNGSYVFYGDGTEAKDLSQNNYEKYRSDIITASNNTIALRETPVANTPLQNTNSVKLYPNPVTNSSFKIETSMQGVKQVKVVDDKGAVSSVFQFNANSTTVNTTRWAKGNYQLIIISNTGAIQTQRIIVLH
jgi:hypothetical protein